MNGVLTQARQSTQAMAGQMTQTMAQVGGPAQEPLGQAHQIMNQVRQDIEAGLHDPVTFRHRFGLNRPEDAPLQPTREPGFKRGVEPTAEPVPSEEPAPLVDAAPTEEPGDCPAGDCEPTGDQNRFGRDSDEIPGYGEPCENPADCPAGDENKYQAPGPHSDGCDDPSTGCEPAGDEHRYGQDTGQSPGPQDEDNVNCPESGDCSTVGNKDRQGQPTAVPDEEPTVPEETDQNDPPAEPENPSSGGSDQDSSRGGHDKDGGNSGGGGKK